MKTLEEIKAHLSTTVYDEGSKHIISGFLFGNEIIKGNESLCLDFAIPQKFDDFVNWFNESEENTPKAKVYKDDKWFDITFDEIFEELKKFRPVICDAALSDEMIERIMKELGIKEEKPRYKYTGSERSDLIKKKNNLELIIKKNDKFIKDFDGDCMFVELIMKINNLHKFTLKEIEDKLNETVD